MTHKDRLTNEKLNKFFDNPFSLVNYAIKQAKHRIAKGDVRASNAAIEALILLERDGVQECFSDEVSEVIPVTHDKKREGVSSGRKKDPSAYVWSDLK